MFNAIFILSKSGFFRQILKTAELISISSSLDINVLKTITYLLYYLLAGNTFVIFELKRWIVDRPCAEKRSKTMKPEPTKRNPMHEFYLHIFCTLKDIGIIFIYKLVLTLSEWEPFNIRKNSIAARM